MREEAQALLAEYQHKAREAEKEAEDIVSQAARDADALAVEAAERIKDYVERRTKMAEQKIAQAEIAGRCGSARQIRRHRHRRRRAHPHRQGEGQRGRRADREIDLRRQVAAELDAAGAHPLVPARKRGTR